MSREPISQYSRRLVEPILSSSEGLYTRTTRLGWTVYITNPKIIKSILLKQDLFPKAKIFVSSGEGSLPNKFIVGPNMIFVENADWKRHRKLANPAFQQAMPYKVFGKLTIQMFDIIDESLKKKISIDTGDVLKRLTLDALTLAGFGFNIHALQDPNNEWLRTYQSIITGMQDPLFFFFPIFETRFLHMFPKRQVIHDDCDRFLKLMDDMIKKKRDIVNKSIKDTVIKEDSQEKDILTLLLEGEESEDAYMTNEELKSNLCAFFSAGHDSTTGALSFALYYMAVNQDIQQKARDEILGILGDSNKDIIPNATQTKAMGYLNMIIKETLRIQPSVPVASARKAKEDCKLGSVFIPKDTILLIDIYNTHRSPSNWDDPHTFNPERFRPGGEADQKTSGEFGNPWIPFSNGARQCIGMNFSLAEQRVVLSMLLRKYTWSLPKGSIHETNVITKGIFFIVAKDLELSFTCRY
ncbi:cytochrome P-450 cyp509A1 [Thamnidium elegans]|nr:cytochrome P-450 cyp509A1 [Thamnidium elegans]